MPLGMEIGRISRSYSPSVKGCRLCHPCPCEAWKTTSGEWKRTSLTAILEPEASWTPLADRSIARPPGQTHACTHATRHAHTFVRPPASKPASTIRCYWCSLFKSVVSLLGDRDRSACWQAGQLVVRPALPSGFSRFSFSPDCSLGLVWWLG